MSNELTEENLKRIFDEMGEHTNPDTFMVSGKQLELLKSKGLVKYDRIKCSWELLSEKLAPVDRSEDKS